MKTLTPQILGLYIGQWVKHDAGKTGTIASIGTDGQMHLEIDADADLFLTTTESVRPILRPLSSMTEEEQEHLDSLNNIDRGTIKHYKNVGILEVRPNEFLYLLSRGFDLFGLIDSGLAIEKK